MDEKIAGTSHKQAYNQRQLSGSPSSGNFKDIKICSPVVPTDIFSKAKEFGSDEN